MSQPPDKVTNIVVAGLGGQGVLKASDILVDAIFRAGHDVKKSEVHGMSQRGGSVCSDIRYGRQVFSPMVPPAEADFLVVLSPDQVAPNQWLLRPSTGTLITPDLIDATKLPNKKSLNVAMLGFLSSRLDIPAEIWLQALKENFAETFFTGNSQAFELGRQAGKP
ncbi:MAG: indolepyruvate oxidoreductase subunit beta [Verrucomicrobiota bacterium]